MCEFCDVFKNSIPEYQLWMKGINIPETNFFKILLTHVRPSVCPITNRYLSHEEMFPAYAKCSRSLSAEAYEQIFASKMHTNCVVCGYGLPHDKVRSQQKNGTREVRNHMHEECAPQWALMHSRVVGYPPEAEKVANTLRTICSRHVLPSYETEHIIDVPYTEVKRPALSKGHNLASISGLTSNSPFGNNNTNRKDLVHVKLPW